MWSPYEYHTCVRFCVYTMMSMLLLLFAPFYKQRRQLFVDIFNNFTLSMQCHLASMHMCATCSALQHGCPSLDDIYTFIQKIVVNDILQPIPSFQGIPSCCAAAKQLKELGRESRLWQIPMNLYFSALWGGWILGSDAIGGVSR